MPAQSVDDDQEPYASSQDSDFAPDDGAAVESDSASNDDDDDEHQKVQPGVSKVTVTKKDVEDAGYDNSGDEAIIKKGAKKRRKAKAGYEDDEEGGEGGLIKTRKQRAAEKEERKIAAAKGPVTIDVDAVWAQMLAGQPVVSSGQRENAPQPIADTNPSTLAVGVAAAPFAGEESHLVRIRRTYNFAGRVHTEEKIVERDSAEAKLYIASGGQLEPVMATASSEPLDAPPRRATSARKAFRSSFEPQLDVTASNATRRTDLDLGVAARTLAGQEARAKKLNTVEKSRMDWAGFVDKEGLRDELELAGRSKGSYVARQDFLDRSEMRREDDARRARMVGRA